MRRRGIASARKRLVRGVDINLDGGYPTNATWGTTEINRLGADLDACVAAGVTHIREYAFARGVTYPQYSDSCVDNFVTACNARGLKIMACFDPNQTQAEITRVVNRYKGQGVKLWEAGNEVNLANGHNFDSLVSVPSGPARYFTALQNLTTWIKAADPTAQVTTSGFSQYLFTDANSWGAKFFGAGNVASICDAMNFHPYGDTHNVAPFASPSPNATGQATIDAAVASQMKYITDLIAQMNSFGLTQMNIYMGEFGWREADDPASNSQQINDRPTRAAMIKGVLDQMAANPRIIQPTYLYVSRADGNGRSSLVDGLGSPNWSWIDCGIYQFNTTTLAYNQVPSVWPTFKAWHR